MEKFTSIQLFLVLSGSVLFFTSLVTQYKNQHKITMLHLGLSTILIFSYVALLDPILNLWDERFHALVAKNMMSHPFMPTLYDDPVVNMNYDYWDRFHIWLHKQPLFLWQIALSYKFFGVSEFALRFPSVLSVAILVVVTYRSGQLLANSRTGYVAACFVLSSSYIIELVTGRQIIDHNDLSFIVYISLSLWAWLEYEFSNKRYWIYLIGLFSGMAILCKWLVGLLVYFGWGVLRIEQKKVSIKDNKDFLISLLITVIVALPWQVFTFIRFPAEAIAAYKFNTDHFSVPLDGKSGGYWYHIDCMSWIYGKIVPFIIVPAFYFLYKKMKGREKLFYALVSMVLIVYLFFALAATKMPSFTVVVSMIIFIALATLLMDTFDFGMAFVRKKIHQTMIFVFIFIGACFAMFYGVNKLQHMHNPYNENNEYSQMMMHNKNVYQSLNVPENSVLFQVKGHHYVEAMFYTNFPSYNFLPSYEQYQDLKDKQRTIVIFSLSPEDLPDYLRNDTEVIVVNQEIQGYE